MAYRQQTAAALFASTASQPPPVTATLSLRTGRSNNAHRPPSEPTDSCDNARNGSTLLSDRPAKTPHDPLSGVHDAAHTAGGQVAAEPGARHGEPVPSISLPASASQPSPPLPTFTVATAGLARNFSHRFAVQSQPIKLTRSSYATDETSASRPPLLSSTVSSWPTVIDDSPPLPSLPSNSSLEPPSKDAESSTPHRLPSAQRSQTPVVRPASLLHTSSAESLSVAKAGPALLFGDSNNYHNSNGDNNNEKEAGEKQIHQQQLLYNPSRVPSHSPLSTGTAFVLPELDLDDPNLDLDRLCVGYSPSTLDTEQLVAMTTSTFQYTPPFQPPLPPPPPYSEPSAGGGFSSPDLGFPGSGVDGFSGPTADSLHDGDSPRQFRNYQQSAMTQPTPAQSFSRKVSTKIRGFLNHTHRSRSPSSRNSTATVATVSEDSHISSSLPVTNGNKGSKHASPVVVPVVASVTTTVTAPATASLVEPVSSTAMMEASVNAAVDDFMDAHTAMEVPVAMPMMDAVDDRLRSQESQTFDGHIPIMNGCQPDSEIRSGHSSYISLDSPTLATESSGNPSNRNSFRSFAQEERPRSRSPESPVTPDDDYRFNNRMPDSKPKYHAAAELQTDYSRDEESTHDGVESQVVPVYLDERNESRNGMIPSLLIETASPTCRLHPDHPGSFMTPRPAPRSPRNRPASMRSRSPSPAPIMSPLKSLLPESGRETPSFLTPRPAPTTPIPSPGYGPVKPLRSPTEAGPKLLRTSTISSRSAGANPTRAPLSLNPRVRSHVFPSARPSTASNSVSEIRSFREVSALNRVLPPPERLREHDEISIISLGPPSSPNQLHDIERNFPPMPMPNYATSLRKSGSIRSASGRALEIAVPPPLDSRSIYDSRSMFDGRSIFDNRSILGARSVKTASPTTIPDDFKSMTSPKYHPDDAPLSPAVYSPDTDIERDLPPRTPPTEPEVIPTPPPVLAPVAPVQVAPSTPVAALVPPPPEVKRHSTVSKGLRRAFSRRRSTNKRTAGPITGEIISRPSTSATTATSAGAAPEDEPSDDNMSVRSRSMMNPLTPPPSSPTALVSRWKSVRGRSSSTSSSSTPSSQPPAALPPRFKLASVPETAKLTPEELVEIARMPGTIFIRTSMVKEDADQDSTREEDLICMEHRMKPRKGMAGTGVAGRCRFCGKGPFLNMWVCMDACQFVMCRMCANEKVQAGEAELF
ncbi:hypothetical protein HOY82DRAFT_543468 [Tuber indicum]|nr:hypothetical protein HOY82DRAFT_543468 [Tuber indicum]